MPKEIKIRTSKRWTKRDVKLGTVHIVDKLKRRNFGIIFRQRCRYFGVPERCLHFVSSGEKLRGTVMNKANKPTKAKNITKSIYYTPVEKKQCDKVLFGLKQPKYGDKITFNVSRYISFANCVSGYNKRYGTELRFNYEYNSATGKVHVTFCTASEKVRSKIPIPHKLISKNKNS